MNNPREFNLPQTITKFPKEKKIIKYPQNLTPSHKPKLVSCLQLQSTTL